MVDTTTEIYLHYIDSKMKLNIILSLLVVSMLLMSTTLCSPVPQYHRGGHHHRPHHRPHHGGYNNNYNSGSSNGFNNRPGGILPFNGAGLVGAGVGFGLASVFGK